MTKSIKNNLIRFLTFIVAVTCAFSILTMPKTSAMADNATPALEHFWMEDSVELNVTSLEKSGIRFTAGTHINWARYTAQDYSLGKMYPDAKDYVFGIVIADKYYRDQNGDLQERTEVTAETPTAIKIGYIHKSQFESVNPATGQSWFTGGVTKYTASITYREDRLAADFIAHDMAVRAGEKQGNCYFSNEVASANYEGELFDEEFAELMDKVHAEKLMARAYVEITYEDGSKEYVYSENSITNSVRGVATDKYLENKDDESWMAQNGFIAEKYLGTISTKSAYLDKQSNNIIGQDLRGYEEFTLDDASLSVGEDIIVNETSTLSASVVEGLEEGQTYTLTAIDARGNVLFLNVTPATEVITTAEQFKSIFNLSTENKKFCKPTGSFYSCYVDGYYVLGNDIDMTGVKLDHNLVCANDSSATVASYGIGFYGTFDGNGYTISNLDLTRSGVSVYKMGTMSGTILTSYTGSGDTISAKEYYYATVAANHPTTSHSSGSSAGLFASLGYGSAIKNVALTNVKATNSSVIALFTEGGYRYDNASAGNPLALNGIKAVPSTGYAVRYSKTSGGVDISTTCTNNADCPIHTGGEGCDSGKYYLCSGKAHCIHCQTVAEHTPKYHPIVSEKTYYYVAISSDVIYVRDEATITAAQAKVNLENLYIDINDQTSSFRGVFNSFGNAKFDKYINMSNIVINYNGTTANSSTSALLRGENKVGAFTGSTINDVVIIAKNNDSNLLTYSSTAYVASNVDGNKIAGVLQYASLEEYADAIEAGTATMQGFGSYWETEKTQTPTWKNDFTKVTFKVDGEVVVGNSYDYTALALGEQKTFQVTAYDYQGEQITEFDVAKTTDELVATVNKSGLITVAGSTNKTEASTIITLEAKGKTFIATITIQGGFIIVNDKEVTYSQDQGKFNFNGFAVDVDNDDTNDNSVVFNNDTILSATVIYGNETTELTKQEIQIRDYGTFANGNDWTTNPGDVGNSGADSGNGYNTTGDQATNSRYDSTKPFNAFLGENVVKFAVNGEYGVYEPVLYTQQLMVTIQVGEEVRTYVFNNLKAYSAIITNVGQLSDVLAIKSSGQINKGYYVVANNIRPDRGGYQIQHVSNLVSTGGFQGVFDGQGYQINGLRPSVTNTGLFGRIISTEEMPSTIRNISLAQYDASLAKPVVLAASIMSDVYEEKDAGDTKIQVAKYPAEIYNVHNKVTTKTYNGLIGAEAGRVNYKFRNVLVTLEVFNEFFAKDKNISLYTGAGNSALVSMPNYSSTEGRQVWDMRDFARDSYYTNAYENVVVYGGPLMTYLKNSTASNGYTNFDPVETLYLSYGMNKLNKAGIKLSPVVPVLPSNKTPTNITAAQLIVLESQKELTASVEMPYATELANKTYTLVNPENAEDSKTYTTTEQAFFYKGVYHYYTYSEMVAQYNNEDSGEKAMFDGFVSTGLFTKRASDGKLIWAVAGATN